ncbi:MAG: hypothetical protein H0U27_10880 [Nitrosopumilus sp.]|nr:hypothetical protein [Nitrosopumilus sp.]
MEFKANGVRKKMNFRFFLFMVVMASFSSSILLLALSDKLAPSYGAKGLELTNVTLTQDQSKYKHLVGLVNNIGNNTANQIIISANFLGEGNISLGNFSKQTELRSLNPNEITPFDILIFDKKNNEKIKNFKADIKYNLTDHKDKKLDIVANNSRLDMTGFFFINGKIKNSGDTHSNNTNVISILYDKNKELVGVWKAQTEPYDIPPSTTASFTIPVTDKTQSFRISSFTLLTESNNYSELK